MTDRHSFTLRSDLIRRNAMDALRAAPDRSRVTIAPEQRSTDQNAKLHALFTDLARSDVEWAGARRTMEEWKVLMVSGHAVATGTRGEVIPGLEGEFVAIRESTAAMGVARAASLITYVLAFCDVNGVELRETKRGGFYDDARAA